MAVGRRRYFIANDMEMKQAFQRTTGTSGRREARCFRLGHCGAESSVLGEAFFEEVVVGEPEVGDVGGAEAEDVFKGAANFGAVKVDADAFEEIDEGLGVFGEDGFGTGGRLRRGAIDGREVLRAQDDTRGPASTRGGGFVRVIAMAIAGGKVLRVAQDDAIRRGAVEAVVGEDVDGAGTGAVADDMKKAPRPRFGGSRSNAWSWAWSYTRERRKGAHQVMFSWDR
jgi:hypothetical protein